MDSSSSSTVSRTQEIWAEEALKTLQAQMQKLQGEIRYSTKYSDSTYDYRHIFLPPKLARMIPNHHLLTESEWRNLGIQQSLGWEHYMKHNPEPHILLFRRPNYEMDTS
uniref:cyclin-dependent kinases regulatory subunit-like n=1 Tax=Ciona intestinalis TaxID=7719 RepID=UPI0002B8D5F4|nr:cyclin-dependent kinases regulatory subunit-like [Ciona intestinalis]|eukprot:XP_004226606.1 cyclin-dependent kinases regulatory subunit-like [Ciona intestinalis]